LERCEKPSRIEKVGALYKLSNIERFTGRLSLNPSKEAWKKRVCTANCPICTKIQKPTVVEAAPSHEVTKSSSGWKETALAVSEILQDLSRSEESEKKDVNSNDDKTDDSVDELKEDTELSEDKEEEINLLDDEKAAAPKSDSATADEIPSESGPTLALWKEEDPFYVADFEQWKTLEPEFAFFLASKSWTAGAETAPTPYAHMSDGYLDGRLLHAKRSYLLVVVAVRKVNNATLVRILAGLQNGTVVKDEAVEYWKVKGFKLEPTSPGVYCAAVFLWLYLLSC
jgi:hypothetical protein